MDTPVAPAREVKGMPPPPCPPAAAASEEGPDPTPPPFIERPQVLLLRRRSGAPPCRRAFAPRVSAALGAGPLPPPEKTSQTLESTDDDGSSESIGGEHAASRQVTYDCDLWSSAASRRQVTYDYELWTSAASRRQVVDCDLWSSAERRQVTEERFPHWKPHSVPQHGVPHGLDQTPTASRQVSKSEADAARGPRYPVQCSSSVRSWGDLEMEGAKTKEERLKDLNAQALIFITKAQKTISVCLLDKESLLTSQCLFRIDEMTTVLTLRTALAPEQAFQLKDLKSVLQGEALKKEVPHLAHLSEKCLLLRFGQASGEALHCLLFDDVNDRNAFYTNMKVVRAMASSHAT